MSFKLSLILSHFDNQYILIDSKLVKIANFRNFIMRKFFLKYNYLKKIDIIFRKRYKNQENDKDVGWWSQLGPQNRISTTKNLQNCQRYNTKNNKI